MRQFGAAIPQTSAARAGKRRSCNPTPGAVMHRNFLLAGMRRIRQRAILCTSIL